MGQFVILKNGTECFKLMAGASGTEFKNSDGNTFANLGGQSGYTYNNPFSAGTTSEITSAQETTPLPYAMPNGTVNYTDYSDSARIGSTSATFTKTSYGWTCDITVTASADAEIKSFYFFKKRPSYNQYYAVFAYVLDNGVQLNSENNYTVHFTVALTFDEP